MNAANNLSKDDDFKSSKADAEKQPLSEKLDFQAKAKSRVGSLDNASHKPLGGDKKVYQRRLTFRETATSKIGSLQNINHKPGGGNKQIIYQVVAKRSNPAIVAPCFTNVLAARKTQKKFRSRSASLDNSTTTRTFLSGPTESLSTVQRTRQRPKCGNSSAH
ncbi:microtubule-associated protein tau-like [Watersipora subatra]|uniref:microtubule-associated protein tau-like n=1 Tax=Watersipora subatra TaxID=2589382 RepID=UPI00355B45D3